MQIIPKKSANLGNTKYSGSFPERSMPEATPIPIVVPKSEIIFVRRFDKSELRLTYNYIKYNKNV